MEQGRASRPLGFPIVLGALIGLLCVAILGMYAWQTSTAWKSVTREARSATLNLAESLSQQADSTFETADAVVEGVQFFVESRGFGRESQSLLHRLMMSSLGAHRQIHGLFVIDAAGRRVASSLAETNQPVSSLDRAYFHYHAQHRSRTAYIGMPVVSKSDGTLVLTLSRRLEAPDGSFNGVVLATISMSSFDELYRRFDLGGRTLIVLVARDGTIIARRPFVRKLLGASVTNGPMFAHWKTAPSGIFTARFFNDGITRLTAYKQLRDFPIATEVAIPIDEVYGTWRRTSLWGLAGVLALIVLVAVLARLLIDEVRDRERAQLELENVALTDALTGLANRRQFDALLEREWSRAIRDQSEIALLMIDVDWFKRYNDRYGHQLGDDTLHAIAQCLRSSIDRPADVVARYGGEEFAVLLPATTRAGAAAIAENIRLTMMANALPHAESPQTIVTVSVGVATLEPTVGDQARDLLERADTALYAAKDAGRNRVSEWTRASGAQSVSP